MAGTHAQRVTDKHTTQMFPNRSAPVYDDQQNSTDATVGLLRKLVGSNDNDKHVPWLNEAIKLVGWLKQDHEAEPLVAVLDLHDKRLPDLKDFGLPAVGTKEGRIAGWEVAANVILPQMKSGEIKYRIPLIFVSGQPESIRLAKEAISHFREREAFAEMGVEMAILAKPQREDDADGLALRRYILGLARDKVVGSLGALDGGIRGGRPVEAFDHKACLAGLQRFWGLTNAQMAEALQFERTESFEGFLSGKIEPITAHWRRYTETLWSLKGRLSGLKSRRSVPYRMEFEQQWLRTPRASMSNRAPLDVILSGDLGKLELLIAYVEGIDIPLYSWLDVPRKQDGR